MRQDFGKLKEQLLEEVKKREAAEKARKEAVGKMLDSQKEMENAKKEQKMQEMKSKELQRYDIINSLSRICRSI